MVPITFAEELRRALPDFYIGVIQSPVRVTEHDDGLWTEIDARIGEIARSMVVEDIRKLPSVASLRQAYRSLGRDPTRHRGSQEALLRRIIKGKGLYQINTIVDINNLLSIETFFSGGTFNLDQVCPPIELRLGQPGEQYQGIGREMIDLQGLPVLVDQEGPFGCPTSDSERTKVTLETRHILTTMLSFMGPEPLESVCSRSAELLGKYAVPDGAAKVETMVIPSD
jgi:DNA/RNA-binding domain of Phe-tRNA-synthetase-like protein